MLLAPFASSFGTVTGIVISSEIYELSNEMILNLSQPISTWVWPPSWKDPELE